MPHDLLKKVIRVFARSPRVAILLSGSGSNAKVILESRSRYPTLNFVAVGTDRSASNAALLAEGFGLRYVYAEGEFSTPGARSAYFNTLSESLENLGIDVIVYAGFMRITPPSFVHRYPGINIHPADLTILNHKGRPKYIGMTAIRDAIQGGESYIASTVHVVDELVDCGAPIAVSQHLPVSTAESADVTTVHERLKITCEHDLYPKALSLLSMNKISAENTPLQMEEVNRLLRDSNKL